MQVRTVLETTSTFALLVVATIALVTAIGDRPGSAPLGVPGAPQTEVVPNWRHYAASNNQVGPNSSVPTIVVFSDFQCPACRLFSDRITQVLEEYPDSVRFVFRHFPLPAHEGSHKAAHAAECAARQGRFWQFHDALFDFQSVITDLRMEEFAGMADVADIEAFSACLAAEAPAQLRRDIADGQRLGIHGTPTILFQERLIRGAPSIQTIRAMVEHIVSSG